MLSVLSQLQSARPDVDSDPSVSTGWLDAAHHGPQSTGLLWNKAGGVCALDMHCATRQSSVPQARSHGLLPSGECGDYLWCTSQFPSFLENVSAQVRLPLAKWTPALILLPPRDGVHHPFPPGPAHQACCTLHRRGLYALYVRLCVLRGLASFADLVDLAQVRRHRAITTQADGRLETGSTSCYVHFSSPSPSRVEEHRFDLDASRSSRRRCPLPILCLGHHIAHAHGLLRTSTDVSSSREMRVSTTLRRY
ncbi:hypothetical protein K466DRAFT_129413 [Polyporus arcularius HHB13444]|uniref:Uncharacterized protein n=1 Tax=Polyporus arcularius HHB13444 TaxID=1314778 RepID=A0A5C3PX10_9APHY|nr:hypothetical protein K466DRAFT_129413 [Polyporus arcularius HHB13444]